MSAGSALYFNLEGDLRVLFIGNYWPYARGGHRLDALAANANVNDASVVIVTSTLHSAPRPRDGVFVVETSFKGDVYRYLRRLFKGRRGVGEGLKSELQGPAEQSVRAKVVGFLFKLYASLFEYPDAERSWRRPALRAAREILESNRIDVIVSGYPLTSHVVASRVKAESGLPWVADLTDLWSKNHNYPYFGWRRRIDERVETQVLNMANHITTVSEDLADSEAALLQGVPVTSIVHGFPDEFMELDVPLRDTLTLTYVGSLYDRQDGFDIFSRALSEAVVDYAHLRVRFVGTPRDEVLRRAPQTIDTSIFEFIDRVPRSSVGTLIAESHFLLIFGSSDELWSGVHPSKVFDYVGVRRPVLYVGGRNDDLMSRFVKRTDAGKHFFSGAQLVDFLTEIQSAEFDHRFVRLPEQLQVIRSLSHASMSRSMFDIIRNVSGTPGV
jgi:hypothetical protein